MSGPLGAEIDGVSLNDGIADAVWQEIHRAWTDHHVVVFRDQKLSPSAQAEFCSRFGPLATYPFVEATEGHPNVIPIIKEPEQRRNFGGAWHTDSSYMETPPGRPACTPSKHHRTVVTRCSPTPTSRSKT